MSDKEFDVPEVTEEVVLEQDELKSLQERATKMGIKFRSNTGKEKLRELINDTINGKKPVEEPEVEEETLAQKRVRLKKEALKLVRCRIVCMNPNKKEWPGEVITVSNSFISAKKFVPFNLDEGYHIPQIIFDMLKERKCQVFVKKKSRHGVPMVEGKLINEFAIEVLPPLTEQELKDLAQRQAMAGSIE